MAINISFFTEPDDFRRITGDILRQLRASKKMPGQERIYTAGEKEYECMLQREKQGIPLNENLQQEIKKIIAEYQIEDFDFNP